MNHIINKEQYLSAKAAWKNNPRQQASHIIIYNALRGFPLDRGFTETTNPTKLANGQSKRQGFVTALAKAQLAFSPKRIWPRDQERFDKDYEDRMKNLSKYYGVEFTPELMETMREILK